MIRVFKVIIPYLENVNDPFTVWGGFHILVLILAEKAYFIKSKEVNKCRPCLLCCPSGYPITLFV